MYGELIRERDDSQETSVQLRDSAPKTKAVVLLWLDAERGLDDANAHLAREIRPLSENTALEIPGERVIRHGDTIASVPPAAKRCRGLTRTRSATPAGAASNWRSGACGIEGGGFAGWFCSCGSVCGARTAGQAH